MSKLTSTVTSSANIEKFSFPCLRESKVTGAIILFSGIDKGVIVSGVSIGIRVGGVAVDQSNYKPFVGTLHLTQE